MRATAVKYVLTQRLWNLFCKYSGIVKTYYARNERQTVLQTIHYLTCCSKVLISTKIRSLCINKVVNVKILKTKTACQNKAKKISSPYLAKPRKITYTKRKKKLTRDLK